MYRYNCSDNYNVFPIKNINLNANNMAGIDKFYCTLPEYKKVRDWWINTRKSQKDDLGYLLWMYPLSNIRDINGDTFKEASEIPDALLVDKKDYGYWDDGDLLTQLAILNTMPKEDLWLSKNCDLDVIQDQLKEKYSEDWIGFTHKNELNFECDPCIVNIITSDMEDIYFFEDVDDENIKIVEKVIFYGTTYLLKVFYEAIKCLSLKLRSSMINEIHIDYYGIQLKYMVKENIFFDLNNDRKQVSLSIVDYEIFVPEFKHSYNVKEVENYDPYEIFMSHENEAYDITQFMDGSKEKMNRYIMLLPDYIERQINN